MSLCLNPNKNFICIHTMYVTLANGAIRIIKNSEDMKKWKNQGYSENNLDRKINCLTTYWKPLTWNEYNKIASQSQVSKIIPDNRISSSVDMFKFKQLKLKHCLKKWNLRDENNEEVPVTPDNIDNLPADIANEILDHFEDVAEIKSTDLENLEQAAYHFFQNKGDKEKISDYDNALAYIYEHIIARNLKIDIGIIRDWNLYDFHAHLRLCVIYEHINREFESNIAGVKLGKSSGKSSMPKQKGTQKSMQSTKLLKF